MGIEPTSEAWEASILPLYDARLSFLIVLRNWFFVQRSSDPASILACAGEVSGTQLSELELLAVTQEVAGSSAITASPRTQSRNRSAGRLRLRSRW
jgi:hypothetical protein